MKLFKDVWNKRGFKDGPGPVIRKNVAVRNMLEQLHSPNDPEQLYREYQKEKRNDHGNYSGHWVGVCRKFSFEQPNGDKTGRWGTFNQK